MRRKKIAWAPGFLLLLFLAAPSGFGFPPLHDYSKLGRAWPLGAASILSPLLLAWTSPRFPARIRAGPALVLLFLICEIAFTNWNAFEGRPLPLAFLPMAPLVWMALRCEPGAVCAGLIYVAICAAWHTMHGFGPLALSTPRDSLILLSAYLLVVGATTYAVESDSRTRRRGQVAADLVSEKLRGQVDELTAELEKNNAALKARDLNRARSAEAPRSDHELLVAFMNQLPGFAFLKDHEGKYICVNPQAKNLFGREQTEWAGKTAHELFPKERADQLVENDRKVLEGRRTLQVLEIGVENDGTRYWLVHQFLIKKFDESPPLMAGLAIDITKLKQTEAALRHSEEFAYATINALSAHVCVLDECGTILLVNKNWCAFAESNPPTPANYAEGANYLAICDNAAGPNFEEAAPFAAGIRAVIAGERSEFSMEYPCDSATVRRWFIGRVTCFSFGQSSRVLIAHENITERKLAMEALTLSEERFAAFMRHLPGVAFMKDRDGKYVYMNEQSEVFFHKKRAEYLGTTIEDHAPAEFAAQIRKDDERVLDTGLPSMIVRDVPGKEGLRHWLLYRFPIPDKTGARPLLGMIAIDITERVRAEQEVEAALKNEAVLKREIYHRVKNNLQVIISLFYLQSAQAIDSATREVLRQCQSRTRSIALIHELLCRSKDLTRIEFVEYARRLAGDLLIAYRICPDKVSLRVQSEGVFLDMDTAFPCGLILTELVTNSLKHAFADGRKGEIEIDLKQTNDDTLVLTVRDNGPGLPENFSPEKAPTMGFQLVRDLVRQLDGTLEVSKDAGMSATITFPITRDPGNRDYGALRAEEIHGAAD